MESSEQSNLTSAPVVPSTNFLPTQDHIAGMSNSVTPSKRPNDGSFTEPTGKRKLQNSAVRLQNQTVKSFPDCTVFRVLCPDSKIERIAGNGGAIISEICKETSANITVEESVPGCDERLIVIVGSHEGTEASSKKIQEVKNQEVNAEEGGENSKLIKDKKNEEPDPDENSTTKLGAAYAQKALLRVFERLVVGEVGSSQGDDVADKSPLVFRLLVFPGQVNCVLGKSGSTIKKMSADTGAEIRMLAKDQLPGIASASDRLVQIKGDPEAIRRALQSISQQIIDNATRDSEPSAVKPSETSVNSLSRRESHNMPKRSATQGSFSHGPGPRGIGDFHLRGPPPIPLFHETGFHGRIKPPSEALTFRLLSSTDRVGIIIGKGGAVVKIIEQETGCDIKVLEGASDSDERIIVISGPAHPDDRVSPVQDALLRVQNRIIRATPESKEISMTARMLVLSNQIGCLLGKGGSIIAEMRKSTGAYIRILGKDQIPKCASENEEVIQVNGEYDSVQEALVQITNRLRHHFFFSRDPFPSIDHPSNPARLDPMPPYPSSMGRRELSPPGMYSNFGPPIHKFDSAPGPYGAFHPHEDRPPFMHNSFRTGPPPNMHERRPWGPEGPLEGGGPIGHPEFPGGPPRRGPGFGGGNQAPIITSTTIEVVVPRSVVPSIYGEDGWSLKQVRQISDAKVVITESKPGDTETVIIISGTPEQTHAAQSLIQAFVMCERE